MYMPILHFSGRFRSYPPLYNNYPWNPEKYFDPQLLPNAVKEKVTEKVEPLQYFEFEFFNTYISKITYDDGTSTSSETKDPIIGKEIRLKGLLVDVSPHIEKGRLYAGEIRVVDFFIGRLNLAVQSDLFRTVRNNTDKGAKILSADFESAIYDTHSLKNEFVKEENSRFVREVNNNDLKIYFNVNSFSFESLEGKVYGYLGPSIPIENKHETKIHGRRLLIDPSISCELKQDFNIKDSDLQPVDHVLRNDLEGTYEIIEEKRLAILRYLNAVPFSDLNHTPPQGYRFSIALFENGKKIEIPSSSSSLPPLPIIIELDKEDNIARDGGICIFHIPETVREFDRFNIAIMATKNQNQLHKFMIEPKYDLLLNNNQRFLILGSGKKKEEVQVRVYKNNRLCKDSNIELVLKSEKNAGSPTVAWWSTPNTSSNNGIAVCFVETLDLENCKGGVEDPILPKLPDNDKLNIISGELPWDRYYGNYLSLTIQSIEKPIIKVNIPVRVLHSVRPEDIENIDGLDKEKIQDIVTKMLSYYTRYYPWLHVEYRYAKGNDDGLVKPVYTQFLRIKEHLDFISSDHIHDWHSVQGGVTKINHFLDRLERDDNDWRKMPRSRDFPINGIEFLKTWKASLINKVMQDINEAKEKINQDNNNKNKNNNVILTNNLDVNNWGEVERMIGELDNLISLSSLSTEQKKIILMSKIAMYNYMLEKLSMAKLQTGHSHSH